MVSIPSLAATTASVECAKFPGDQFKKYSRGGTGSETVSSIETVVTDKHIRAWSAFLETGRDFLIFFEDDAVFNDDSV